MHRLDLTCLFLDKLSCVLLPILCCSSTGVPSCVFCSVDNTHYPGIELQHVFGYSDINVPTLRHLHHLVRPWVFCLFFPSSAYTPDAMVLDTTSADDPYEARFQKIEGDVQGIRTDITSINTRMGTMTGDIISALRADRAAERPAEASSGPEPSMGCSVLGRGAEPPQFWVLLIWLEPGISHVTWVHYDATMCLACFVCSILPVLHLLRFDLCVL